MKALTSTLKEWGLGRLRAAPDAAHPPAIAALIGLPRAALIGRNGRICGWVLNDPPFPPVQDDFIKAARHAALIGRQVLIPADLRVLADPALLGALPAGTILQFASIEGVNQKGLRRAQRQGIRVAAPAEAECVVLPDASRIERGRSTIVRPLHTAAACLHALNAGAELVGGVFLDRVLQAGTEPRNALLGIYQHGSHLSGSQLSVLLGTDRVLRYRMLRFANALDRHLTRQENPFAFLLERIGMEGLQRALWLLLVTADNSHPLAPALHELALTRARLMELLAARTLPVADHFGAWLTGLCSLLSVDSTQTLPLPADAALALLHGRGPLIPLMNLCCALEAADSLAIDQFSRHLSSIGLNALSAEEALQMHASAVDWAVDAAAQFSD